MSALCTDQSKNKNPQKKKNKVQCLDVYELFNDCVEHDHFYTRRFLIKDHGFALSVCRLLVTVRSRLQEVTRFWLTGKVLGGQVLRDSMGLGVLPLQAILRQNGVLVRGWDRERRAQHPPGTRCSLSCPRAQGLGQDVGQKGLIPPRLLFPKVRAEAGGMERRGRDFLRLFSPPPSEAGPAPPFPSGPTWAN